MDSNGEGRSPMDSNGVVTRRAGRRVVRYGAGLGALGLGVALVGSLAPPISLFASAAASAPVAAAAPAGALSVHPNHFLGKPSGGGSSALGWQSSNWSGYAVTGAAPYTAVTARWVVPAVAPTSSPSYSAAWTGIDGFNNNSLIQTGTEQDFVSGAAHDSAWWTTSNQNFAEQPITSGCTGSLACGSVAPGDVMSAAIQETAPSSWTITLTDVRQAQSWTFTRQQAYSGPGASAEWIMEAPSLGGRIAPLAVYASPAIFDPGTANGSSPALLGTNGGDMVQGHGPKLQPVSIPSVPDRDADGFNISYGSTPPTAPAS